MFEPQPVAHREASAARSRVPALGEIAAGPELGAALEEVALVSTLDRAPGAWAELIAASGRQIAYLQALQLLAVSNLLEGYREAEGAAALSVGVEQGAVVFTAAELAGALGVSSRKAESLIDLAERLEHHPRSRAALEEGRIDLERARAIVEELPVPGNGLDREQLGELEARALEYAETHTVRSVREHLRAWIAKADPAAAEEAHQERKACRGVEFRPEGNGIATLIWTDDAVVIRSAFGLLTGIAREAGDAEGEEPRTLNARRADALADFLAPDPTTARAEVPDVPGPAPSSVQLVVHVPLSALAHPDSPHAAGLNGFLEGVGWVGDSQTRRLIAAADSARALVAEENGSCRHESRTLRYTPPVWMRRTVLAAHHTCRFPGCRRSAAGCDVDHLREYPSGATCLCNLQPLCRRHHNLKTHGGWRVSLTDPSDPFGLRTWTSPTGRRYQDHPEAPLFPVGVGPPGDDPPF